MRVEELISGVRATLALKLYGEDLAQLDKLSGQLKRVLDLGQRRISYPYMISGCLNSYFRDNSIIFFLRDPIVEKEYDLDVELEKTTDAAVRRMRLFAFYSLRDLSSNRSEPGWILSNCAEL